MYKRQLSRCYLFTDLVVLGLSLTYIPFQRIIFSLVTVTVSSYLIDWVQELGFHTLDWRLEENKQGEN